MGNPVAASLVNLTEHCNMTFIVNSPRFTNGGTIYGGLAMGEGRNYLDTRKGYISGKINMLGGNDTVLGGNDPKTSMVVRETTLFRVELATISSSAVQGAIH